MAEPSLDHPLLGFLRSPRYEIFPSDDVAGQVLAHVPREVTLTVTASRRRGMPATILLAANLASLGYIAVPHLAARMIRDRREVGQILETLNKAEIRNVFVVAGDARQPSGEFPDALSLLKALPRDHGISEIGVAGYPQSHPFIPDAATMQALEDKSKIASYIVSNLCFDAATIKRWVVDVRRRGVSLPIYVGMAGVADPRRLLRVSTKIGVADSARFLRGHPTWLASMFGPGGYEPGRFVTGLLPDLSLPERRLAGLHVFTFNEVEPTEMWRQQMLRRVYDRDRFSS